MTGVDERSMPLVVLVLLALGAATALAAAAAERGRSRLAVPAAALASATAVAWLLVNSPLDGPVLLEITDDTVGVHVGDLLALPALGLVAALCRRAWRDGR